VDVRGSGELNIHAGSLPEIYNQTIQIKEKIDAHNESVFVKLINIQEEITSVNDTVKNESAQIQFNLQEVYNWLQDQNTTVYNWFLTTWDNQQTQYGYLQTMNQSIYNLHNITMTKLYGIQDEIADVNTTIINEINENFYNLQLDIQSKYDNIMSAIYDLQQKWLDLSSNIIDELIGSARGINKIGETLGISSGTCPLLERLAGTC